MEGVTEDQFSTLATNSLLNLGQDFDWATSRPICALIYTWGVHSSTHGLGSIMFYMFSSFNTAD